MLSTSAASVVLFRALTSLKKQLKERRAEIRENFEALSRGEVGAIGARLREARDEARQITASAAMSDPDARGPTVANPVNPALRNAGAAAEERRRLALMGDLRCPITLEVMRDPVIAGDGHSYERSAMAPP